MTFYWWDQAVQVATRRAGHMLRRHRVFQLPNGLWAVEPA